MYAINKETGASIEGTAETVPGKALTQRDSFERGKDGRITWEYAGDTKVYWDGQETIEREGKTVFVDENGDEITEDQVELVERDPWKPEPPKREALAMSDQDRNTILAALRYYQMQGLGDPTNRPDAIHNIATGDETEISLDADGIDELCERINS